MALVASVLVLFFLPYLHRSKIRGLSVRQLSLKNSDFSYETF